MNQSLSAVEKVFNIAECIPVVGIISSLLRVIVGKIQLIVGIILIAIGLTLTLFSQDQQMKQMTRAGIEQAMHGILNGIRGGLVFGIGMCTLGIGNVVCIIPNMIVKPPFTPIFKYGSLD